MKFLFQRSRVRRELEEWACGKKLVFANFFFWNSGDKLRKSLEGLYRALLFETLKQCPELTQEVFPEQWDILETEGVFDGIPFRMPEVKAAFDILTGKRTFPKQSFLFLHRRPR